MGCSPPDSWYDEQYAHQKWEAEREKQKQINQTINTVRQMSDEQKKEFLWALGLTDER